VSVFVGVLMMAVSATAIARMAGLSAHGWLMMSFGVGVLILSQIQVRNLRRELQELERRLLEKAGSAN